MRFGIPKISLGRDITILLGAVVILHVASYIVVPVLPVILRSDKGLNAAQVGVVIAAGSLAFQGGSIIGGLLSDRIGKRITMVLGAAIQGIGIIGYGLVNLYLTLTIFSIINGVGSGGQILPGPKNWFPFVIGFFSIISFPSWCGGFAKFLGQWSIWVFGFGNDLVWASFWIILVLAINFISNYSVVEKVQTWIVAFMVGLVIIAVFVAKPDWLSVLSGLIPTIPNEYTGWIVQKYPNVAAKPISLEIIAYLGALGGGTYDYVGYLGLYKEKKWGMLGNPNLESIQEKLLLINKGDQIPLDESEAEVSKAKAWLRATNLDSLVSFGAVGVFSICFMILGVVILAPQQVIPNDTQIMQYQAKFLTMISPIFLYLYQLGVFCAYFGTMYACSSQLYVHTFTESWGPCFKFIKNMKFTTARNIVLAFYGGGGLLLVWTGFSFTTLVSFGAIIGGVFTVGLWALAMIYTEKKFLPKAYRMSTWITVLVGISGVVLTSMGVLAILQFFKIV